MVCLMFYGMAGKLIFYGRIRRKLRMLAQKLVSLGDCEGSETNWRKSVSARDFIITAKET